MHSRNTLLKLSAIALALTATPKLLSETFTPLPVQAQSASPAFTLPPSLDSNTPVKVDGSSSMTVSNDALKQKVQQQYSGSTVDLATNGDDKALQALESGNLSVAALGRRLTQAEIDKGLKEVPISREKIAIIIGRENPFNGDITFDQFAKIFRGEITNWSEVGGPSVPIRFVDRPESSDTRQAFRNYPVFKEAPFQTGATATKVATDDTAAVIKELGKDGIGYAIADQVQGQNTVKIVPMHKTLPTDPRYPFSQARVYVYKNAADPAAAAFLGLATGAVVAAAPSASVEASPSVAASPSVEASPSPAVVAQAPAADRGGLPSWLWWLLLPLLGGLLWWLMRGRGGAVPAAVPAPVPVAPIPPPPVLPESRIILTPRDCRNAYAYWEVPDGRKAEFREQGGRKLALRLYDVTDIDLDRQAPHSVKQFDCNPADPDLHIPIATDNRDYVAELGYVTEDGRWLKVARSEHVRVPACPPAPKAEAAAPLVVDAPKVGAAVAAGAAVAGAAALISVPKLPESRIILTPRDCRNAYAYWEVPDGRKAEFREQGGRKLALRLYDVTDIDLDRQAPHSVKQFDCNPADPDLHIPIATDNRDYVAELGYVTEDGRWLKVARSAYVRVPACPPVAPPPVERTTVAPLVVDTPVEHPEIVEASRVSGPTVAAGAAGAAAVGGAVAAGAAALGNIVQPKAPEPPPAAVPVSPKSRIVLTPRDTQHAYAYWEIPEAEKAALKQQGGHQFVLRLHDVTGLSHDAPLPTAIQQVNCDDADQDQHLRLPAVNRDYLAEIGYLTGQGNWLKLAHSNIIRVLPTTNETVKAGGTALAGATAAVRSVVSEPRPAETARQQPVHPEPAIAPASPCSIQQVTVHSRQNCFILTEDQMRQLQNQTAVTKPLGVGTHLVRIKSGAFGYGSSAAYSEPLVMLWIQGGRVINKKTNVPVVATWTTLNGYDETLTLEVHEPTMLHAFFFDTHLDDNDGEVTLSVVSLPS
jgi:phosphate transport system substrate-binding protein